MRIFGWCVLVHDIQFVGYFWMADNAAAFAISVHDRGNSGSIHILSFVFAWNDGVFFTYITIVTMGTTLLIRARRKNIRVSIATFVIGH